MDDHARGEYGEFALNAGVAVERLCKAVLVSKNPIYIAEMKGSAEMLFHLGGHRVASKVRTIGAAEAIARLRTLNVLPADRKLDLLIDLRNGVAHASTGNQAKGLLSTLAAAVAALHEESDQPLNSFWGRWTESANAWRSSLPAHGMAAFASSAEVNRATCPPRHSAGSHAPGTSRTDPITEV